MQNLPFVAGELEGSLPILGEGLTGVAWWSILGVQVSSAQVSCATQVSSKGIYDEQRRSDGPESPRLGTSSSFAGV